jgi:DNA-binding transcriptional LysR family regulator
MNQNAFTQQVMNRLRLRQCALLLAIDEQGTLHAAAAKVGMTQPAATKMLQELEDTLGSTLFDRLGRGLVWNAAGQRTLAYCRSMRGSMNALGRDLSELQRHVTGKLTIGSVLAASTDTVCDGIVYLKQNMPKLSIEVVLNTSDHLMALLEDGTIDVMIGRLANHSTKDFDFVPLHEEVLSVVVGIHHRLSRSKAVLFNDLQAYPWIVPLKGSPMRAMINSEFDSHHMETPEGLIETASILTTVSLLSKTQSVAVIPLSIAKMYEEQGLLAVLPYEFKYKLADYGSIVKTNRPNSAAVDYFLAWLHRNIAQTAV